MKTNIATVCLMAAVFALGVTPIVEAARIGAFATYMDTDDAGDGAGAGLLCRLDLASEVLNLDFRGSWVDFSDSGFEIVPLELSLYARLPIGPLGLYGGVGAGYYIMDSDAGSADDAVGLFPLAGLDLVFGEHLGIFVEGRWLYLETDLEKEVDIETVDLTLDGVGVSAGLTWRF